MSKARAADAHCSRLKAHCAELNIGPETVGIRETGFKAPWRRGAHRGSIKGKTRQRASLEGIAGLPSVGGRPVLVGVRCWVSGAGAGGANGRPTSNVQLRTCRLGVSAIRVKEKVPRPEKAAEVEELRGIFERARGAILADYRGLDVKMISTLRRRLREAGVIFRVVKNTLLVRAAAGLPAEKLVEGLEGPTAVAYTEGDPVDVAKALTGFIREFRLPAIKGGLAEGHVMDAEQVQTLATMPPRPVLLAQVVGGLQAPIASLVGTLQQLYSEFVWTLQGVADRRQQ